ncbi:MAG: hypothetical protein Q6367_001370, partial [Candidatus Freyarchaeota archaeon]
MSALKELKCSLSIGMFKLSLRLMGLLFRISPKLRKEVYNKKTGFIFNAKYQFKTRDGKVNIYVVFKDGKMKVRDGVIDNPNITIYYKDKETMAKIWNKSPEESLNYLLTNEMNYVGNMAYLTKFSYMTTVIKGAKIKGYKGPRNRLLYPIGDIDKEKRKRLQNEIL